MKTAWSALCLCLCTWISAQELVYLSPLPGADLVSPYHTVILHFDSAPDAQAFLSLNQSRIEGTRSGPIPFTIDQVGQSKFLLKPDHPMLPLETVEVTLPVWIGHESYRFTISPEAESKDQVSDLRLDTLPEDFPPIVVHNFPGATNGEIFMSPVVGTPYKLVILDGDGEVLSFLEDQVITRFLNFSPVGEDHLVFHRDPSGQESAFYVTDREYTAVDSFRAGPGQTADSHDVLLLDNGNAIVLVYDRQPVDMSTIVTGGNPNAQVTGLLIQEVDNQRNVIWEWRSWDHFEITDGISQSATAFIDFTGSNISYVHANSLAFDPDSNLILSSRNMHEVTKIDRQTGEVIWRMGGKNNQFMFVNDTTGFTDQHDARIVAPGRMTVFDNGNFHETPLTRVVEYEVDELNMKATLVWSFDNPYGTLSVGSGNAQRLPNGNTFIGWGIISPSQAPIATEVSVSGEIVQEVAFFDGQNYVNQYSYRWFKTAEDTTTSVVNLAERLPILRLFPVPAHRLLYVELDSDCPEEPVFTLISSNYRVIPVKSEISPEIVKIHLPEVSSGMYFLRIICGDQSSLRTVLVIGD